MKKVKKISKKCKLIFSIFIFNFNLLSPFLLANCSKKINDLSFVYDPSVGKKYFFTDLIKTNICGVSGDITIGDKHWERSKFDLPIFLSEKVQKIDDNFLRGCLAYNHEIIIPNSCFEIGNNFLCDCQSFKSNLVLPPNLKKINNNFMKMCSSFDGKGKIDISNLKNLIQIGDYFMYRCENFNNNDIVFESNKLLSVGKSFLSNCYNFDSNISFNTPILSEIGNEFLSHCKNLNHKIDLSKCDCLKLIPHSSLCGCEKFNSEFKLPKYLERIGADVMKGCREYNYDNFSSGKLPKSLKRINGNFLYGCEKYNHDFVVPLNTKIDSGFLHNCYSLESTIDIGLNNFDDTIEHSETLCCEFPKVKDLPILGPKSKLRKSKDILSIFQNAIGTQKNCFNDFSFIVDNNDKSNHITDISLVLKWFLDENVDRIINNSDVDIKKNKNDFINLLIYSWKLQQILDYFFKKNRSNKEYIHEDIINSMDSDDVKGIQDLHDEIISFCKNYKYFLSGVKLKTLDNKTEYKRIYEKINNETWRYTDQQNPLLHGADDIGGIITSLFGYADRNYKDLSIKGVNDESKKPWKPSTELSELKLVNWLYEFVIDNVVHDDKLKDEKLEDFIIEKILDLNNVEMELFSLYLNHFIPLYFLDKKLCDKFKNNFNKILDKNHKLKETLKINSNYSLLPSIKQRFVVFVNYLDLVTKLVQKDGKDKYYRYTYNAINKVKEIVDEKDRLIITKLLDEKELTFTNNQWLTYLSLSSLVDKRDLIEKIVDENFNFEYDQSNIIKKINGEENINLNDFERNIFGQIKNQLLIDILYSFSFDDIKYEDRSCLEDFIKRLFEEKFIENWFEKIIQKDAILNEFFGFDKLFNFFKVEYWDDKVNKLDSIANDVKKKWDNYEILTGKFVEILHKNFSRDNIVVVAKNIIKKNFLSSLINKMNDCANSEWNKFIKEKDEFKEEFVNYLKKTFGSFNSEKLISTLVENKDNLQEVNEDFENYNWAIFMFGNNLVFDNLLEKLNDQNWKNKNNAKLAELANNLKIEQEGLINAVQRMDARRKGIINSLVSQQEKQSDEFKTNFEQTKEKLQEIKKDLEKYNLAIFMFDNNFDWDELVENLKDKNWLKQYSEELINILKIKEENLGEAIENFSEQKKNEINDLIKAQELSFDVYGNCEFLFEKNYLIKKLDDAKYVDKLLDIIYDYKFVDKSKLLLLYLHLFNIDYNLWIGDEIKTKQIKNFFVDEVIKKSRSDFHKRLKEELSQFYDDEYDDYSKKLVLKDLYDNFIDDIFTINEDSTLEDTTWFDVLFSLGQNDEKLKEFIDIFVMNKNSTKLQELKQYGDIYFNFKYEVIFIFKKILADTLKRTNISFFIDISNNIFVEDSFILKICMLILKIYDNGILNIKNNKVFYDNIYNIVNKDILSDEYKQFVSAKTNNNSDYSIKIIDQIKSHKNKNWFNFETIIKNTDDILKFFNDCVNKTFLDKIHKLDDNFFKLVNEKEHDDSSSDEIVKRQQMIDDLTVKINDLTVKINDLKDDDDVSESQVWNLEMKKNELENKLLRLEKEQPMISGGVSLNSNSIKKKLGNTDINDNLLLLFISDYCDNVKNIFNFIFNYDSELYDMKPWLDFDYEEIQDIDGQNSRTGYYLGEDGSDNDGIILKNLFNFIAKNFDKSIIDQIDNLLFDINDLSNDKYSDKYDKEKKYFEILANFIELFNLFNKENIIRIHKDKYINEKFPEIKTLPDILIHIKKVLMKNNKKYQQQLLKNANIYDVYSVYKNLNHNFNSHLLLRKMDSQKLKKLEDKRKQILADATKTSIEIFIKKCEKEAKKKRESEEKYVNLIDASNDW